jgi:hypothetical protein
MEKNEKREERIKEEKKKREVSLKTKSKIHRIL